MTELEELAVRLREFAAARDWQQFHSPKNLSAALSVEAAEVLEHFQWLSEQESQTLPAARRDEIALELADVLLYLIRLADQLGISLVEAAKRKLAINSEKYPVERARGSSRKYTEL
jgi:NTP pyrophosphatase (non-canonical NTP hydrolase)